MNQQQKEKMTEKQSRYEAVSQMAELLRETTKKRTVYNPAFDSTEVDMEIEYFNSVFNKQEHETVKRAFLKLCQEL